MLLRFIVTMAGPGVHWQAGQVCEVDDRDALRIVDAGYAEHVTGPAIRDEVETATDPKPETAERRPGRKPKRK